MSGCLVASATIQRIRYCEFLWSSWARAGYSGGKCAKVSFEDEWLASMLTGLTMYTASDISKYFLCLCDEEAGDLLTNMKLQKLLYYAQGVTLALTDAPLFEDRIKAWVHGPVVPQVWREYRGYGSSAIPKDAGFDPGTIDPATCDILNEVYSVYGQFSAWKLRNMTHSESPWLSAGADEDISHTRLKDFFKTQLN